MTNFKALGIEKDIIEYQSQINNNTLSNLINSSYFDHPLISKRQENQIYCNIRIINCQHDDLWYRDLIGCVLFVKIRYQNFTYGRYISEFVGVKLTSTKEITFRSVSSKDAIII